MQISERTATRIPVLAHDKNRHEQDVRNFPLATMLCTCFKIAVHKLFVRAPLLCCVGEVGKEKQQVGPFIK